MITCDATLVDIPTERLEAEVQTLAGHLAAATCRWLLLVAELDRREAWRSWEVASMAHWLSWKCGVSVVTGREHVRVALALDTLPLVRERFERGELSYSKVRALCRLVAIPEMEADLVELAGVATAAQLDRIAAGYCKAQHFADPERDRRNHAERRWRDVHDDDGMATLTVRAPVDVIAEIKTAVDAAVKREVPADAGDMAARRVDGLAVLAHHFMQPDSSEPVATTLVVRQDAPDDGARDESSGDADATTASEPCLAPPARLYGLPIARSAYERLRCDASVAVEQALRDGSVARSPVVSAIPRRIRRAVRARDMNTCRWPGCTNTAHLHVHHIVYRSQCGRHTIENLVLLCSHHHTVVHLGSWQLSGDANGRLQITGLDGREILESQAPRPTNAGRIVEEHERAGAVIGSRTIATAYNEPLRLHWAVGNICDLEEVRRRRN